MFLFDAHLLLETPRGNLAAILHHLNTSYTNYFNAKTGRVGHLFQGRYRALLVEKDRYALELSRYIHLNPVRARLVEEPMDYRWSSFWAYVGKKVPWGWLRRDFLLGQMGRDEKRAQERYWEYVQEALGAPSQGPWQKVVASTLLGSEGFIKWVKERWVRRRGYHRDIPAIKKFSSGPDLNTIFRRTEEFFGEGTLLSRKVGLYLSHRLSGFPLGEIGKFFGGISPSAVSQNTRRFENLLQADSKLSKEVDRLKSELSQ